MESMRAVQVNSLQMPALVRNAVVPSRNTDPSFSAHLVDRSRLNHEMREACSGQKSVLLAEIRRNDSLLTMVGAPGERGSLLAVVGVQDIGFPNPYRLSDLLWIGDTSGTSTRARVFYLVTPNSRTNTWLVDAEAFDKGNRALFGLLDRCVYPDCTTCRQSALCVTGNMVFAVCHSIRLSDFEAPSSSYKIGDHHESTSFSILGTRLLTQPFFPLEHMSRGLQVTAQRTEGSEDIRIEFTRSV